jgi:hypothetical protein
MRPRTAGRADGRTAEPAPRPLLLSSLRSAPDRPRGEGCTVQRIVTACWHLVKIPAVLLGAPTAVLLRLHALWWRHPPGRRRSR